MSVKSIIFFIAGLSFNCSASNHFNTIEALKSNHVHGYSVFKPVKNAEGLLVLLNWFPGGNDDPDANAENVFVSSKLADKAFKKNIVTMVIPYNGNLFIDDDLFLVLRICISDALDKFRVKNGNFALGGFSAGGNIAFGYAERSEKERGKSPIPKVVFGVDPPLDLEDDYQHCIREINRNCEAQNAHFGIDEAKHLKALLDSLLGAPSETNPKYLENSPFSMKSKDGGNASYLRDIPVRLYHEIDAMWAIKERCRTLEDQNVNQGVSMIQKLYWAGNKEAEVIISQNKGIRPNGMRHPHSWSIVDEKECIEWVEKHFRD
jgi:hypothetical protein